jgi:hypothetical protein
LTRVILFFCLKKGVHHSFIIYDPYSLPKIISSFTDHTILRIPQLLATV